MKIGYLSPTNPFEDRRGWSGTYYNICQALMAAGHEVEWIPYQTNGMRQKILGIIFKLVHFGKGNSIYWKKIGKIRVGSIKKELNNYDLIFVPAQSEVLAWIKTDTPIIYYSDATIPLMVDYYWHNVSKKSIELAEKTEKKALDNASLKIYSSNWAANSAVDYYKQDKERVKVLLFGANLPSSIIKPNYKFKKGNTINILFSGVDWKRKGGEIAVKAVEKLVKDGYPAKLYICGIRNLDNKFLDYDFVINKGFLDKNNSNELEEYISLWKKADLFILPTQAECSAIVYSEASGFGVPIISTETGGISDYVINGVNGYRMRLSDDGDSYASKIEYLIDNDELKKLSYGALKLYKESTSWRAWGEQFNNLVKKYNSDFNYVIK